MVIRLPLMLLPLLAFAAAAQPAPAPAPASDSVRIYRCVASNGAVALQDAPCSSGRQQIREMQRPQDPPPRSVGTAPSGSSPPLPPAYGNPSRNLRSASVRTPQPMYECVGDDGQRYTSDSAEGNPRWVPIWVHGYGRRPSAHPALPPPSMPSPRPGMGGRLPADVIVPVGSTLVRDPCHALPPQEVCARLKDRRWELIRRYNSALQSEREQLVREQRGIDARLDQDCGGA